jgi:hypothetical protein
VAASLGGTSARPSRINPTGLYDEEGVKAVIVRIQPLRRRDVSASGQRSGRYAVCMGMAQAWHSDQSWDHCEIWCMISGLRTGDGAGW